MCSSDLAVILRGECLPEPELHDFKALAATDVTSTSYTANWKVPANDVVDYYVVTRTVYADGAAASEDIEAETNELLVDGCEPGTRESYNVRSARLGFFSARSNEVFVDLESGGIMDVSVDNPLAIYHRLSQAERERLEREQNTKFTIEGDQKHV